MRDEMDARIWVEHHAAFSEGIDRALAGLRSAAGRLAGRLAAWDGSSHQLIALVLALAITGLTFQSTSA